MMPAAAAGHDLRRVGVEDAVIVRLAVLGESLVHGGVRLDAGGLQAVLDHAQPAIRHDGAAERLVGLQADDHLVVAVDVAGPDAPAVCEGVWASASSTPFFISSRK